MSSHLDRKNRVLAGLEGLDESKCDKYGKDDDHDHDDEEDALLDEMLEKAERLRLAMLAASSAMNLGVVEKAPLPATSTAAPPTLQASPFPIGNKNGIPRSHADAVDINVGRIVTRIAAAAAATTTTTTTGSIVPAIPTTIDMADTVTECSSVGYYSIVYGTTNLTNLASTKIAPGPQKTTSSSSRQWLRGEPLTVSATATMTTTYHRQRNVQVVTEEEKTNEDGSVHYAFSDDGSSRRSRRLNGTSTAVHRIATTTWSVSAHDDNDGDNSSNNNNDISLKSCNSQELSPVAVAPPDDDEVELVSVADYLKSSNSNGDPTKNKDYVTWVKVDFVDQSDDDYVPLQDYSRTVLYHRFNHDSEGQSNLCTSGNCNNPKTQFRRRKHLRKMVAFGLCCVVLAFVWSRLSNHRTNGTNAIKPTRPSSKNFPTMVDPAVIGTGKTVAANHVRAQPRAIAGSTKAAAAGNATKKAPVTGYRTSTPTARSPNCSRPKKSAVTAQQTAGSVNSVTGRAQALVPVNHRPNNNNNKQDKRAYSHQPKYKRLVLGSLVRSMMYFGTGDYPYQHGSARTV